MKYVIDTNVLYRVSFGECKCCNLTNASEVLNNNYCIVSYATLFEAFNRYKDEKNKLRVVLECMNKYRIDVAASEENIDNVDDFWKLIYSENLSDEQIDKLRNMLNKQTSRNIVRFLGQFMKCFAFLYTNMKIDKEDNAYNSYVIITEYSTDNFSHFSSKVEEVMDLAFIDSYSDVVSSKFSKILNDQLGGIIKSIEAHYDVLSDKKPEYIVENDFGNEIKNALEAIDINSKDDGYMGYVRKAYDEMVQGKKRIKSEYELFSLIDTKELTPLGADFMSYSLKKIFVDKGKFKYNDIIDYINLFTAYGHADGYLSLDKKFLEAMTNFKALTNLEFCSRSIEMSHYLIIEK